MSTDLLALPNNAGVAVGNATIPAEGPKAVPILLDFTAQPSYKVDPLSLYQQKTLSLIQCIYVDNSENAQPLVIDIPGTSQTVICPPLAQGYFPILSPKSNTINFTSPGAGVGVRVELINVPMPAAVWFPGATGAAGNRYTPGGALETSDVNLAPIIDPVTGLKVQGQSSGGGGGIQDTWNANGIFSNTIGDSGIIHLTGDFGGANNTAFTNLKIGVTADAYIAG